MSNAASGSGSTAHRRIGGWAEARKICERIGARLCTVDELLDGPGPPGRLSALGVFRITSVLCGASGWPRRGLNSQKRRFPARAEVTKNTGCGHDGQMVWSSQTSAQCGTGQHMIAPGGRNIAHQICPEECPQDNTGVVATTGCLGGGCANQASSFYGTGCTCKVGCAACTVL